MDAVLRIGEVARRTGVSVDTLRAWEKRYQVLRPDRTPGGHRLYAERDVARVQQVQHLVNDGWSVAAAAAWVADQEFTAAEAGPAASKSLVGRLEGAFDAFDARSAGHALDEALELLDVATACDEVIAPVMRAVCHGWESDPRVIAREHLATQIVRARLLRLLPAAPGPTSRGCLAAAPEAEEHDVGLLMGAVTLASEGWHVRFLGARTPTTAVTAAAAQLRPRIVMLATMSRHHAESILERPPDTGDALLVLGGPGFEAGDTVRFVDAIAHSGAYVALGRKVEMALPTD